MSMFRQSPTRCQHWLWAIVLFLCSSTSIAQAEQDTEAAPKVLQRVSVTGYHIKRIDAQGPAPVVVYDRAMLDESGVNTLKDFARYLTQNNQVPNDSESTLGSNAGAAHIDLRGIGADSTLTLLNGFRIAPYGSPYSGNQAFVDINGIPMAAIDRIEILKDGASAIYGADAVAGVVNIILRDHYDGTQVTADFQKTIHGDGAQWTADVVSGFTRDRTRFMFSLSYLDRDPIFSRDRDFSSDADFSDRGGPNRRSFYSRPPTIIRYDTLSVEPDADCGTDPSLADVGPFRIWQGCLLNTAEFTREIIESRRSSATLALTHELVSGTTFFADAIYNLSESFDVNAPSPIANSPNLTTFFGLPLVLPDHPNNPLGVPMEIGARALDAGLREFENDSRSYRVVAGVEGFAFDWDWRVSAMHSASKFTRDWFNAVLTTRFQDALLGSGGPEGNLYYNPFGANPQNDPAVIDWISVDAASGADRTESSLDATFSTFLGDFQAGDIGLAVGLQYREQDLRGWADDYVLSDDIAGTGRSGLVTADRDVTSVYVEFSLPLLDSLEAQVAARWEHYSDFGSTTNPKLALRWQPTPSWMLRASYSTSFKPPAFEELYEPPTQHLRLYFDRPRCDVTGLPEDCDFFFYDVEVQGNPGLQPEEGESYFLGAMWAPESIPGFQASLDLWEFHHSERIIAFSPQIILDQRGDVGIVRGTPTQEDIAIGAPARIVLVQETQRNSDKLKTSGFDTSIRHQWTTDGDHEFDIRLSHTYISEYEFVDTQILNIESGLNFAGRYLNSAMPRNRANLNISWTIGPNSASAGLHYAGHYENVFNEFEDSLETDRPWTIASHTTFDLQFTHKFEQLRNATFSIGCQNCTDRDPPYTAIRIGENIHERRGAIVYLRWQQPLQVE